MLHQTHLIHIFSRLVCYTLILLLPIALHAQNAEADTSEAAMEAAYAAFVDSVEAAYAYQTGAIPLADGVATINVPAGCKFLDAEQSRAVLVDVWGNPPAAAEGVLGMIFQENAGVFDDTYTFVVEYDPMGYVSDEDADDIDYDELLTELMNDSRAANEERRAAGYEGLELVGWAAPPFYDNQRKVLHWAKELHADSAEVKHEYGYDLAPEMKGPYDAIIVAVNHSEYTSKDEAWFKSMLKPKAVLVDLKRYKQVLLQRF